MQIKHKRITKEFFVENRFLPVLISTILAGVALMGIGVPTYFSLVVLIFGIVFSVLEARQLNAQVFLINKDVFIINKNEIRFCDIKEIKIINNYLLRIKTYKKQFSIYELTEAEWNSLNRYINTKKEKFPIKYEQLSSIYLKKIFCPPILIITPLMLLRGGDLPVISFLLALSMAITIGTMGFLTFFKVIRIRL